MLSTILTLAVLLGAQNLGDASSDRGRPPEPPTEFDTLSIRPHQVESGQMVLMSLGKTYDGFEANNMPLSEILTYAYELPMSNFVTGLPRWASTEGYDMRGKWDPETVATLSKLTSPLQNQLRRRMVIAALKARCGLTVTVGAKPTLVYDLVVAKSGTSLTSAPSNDQATHTENDVRVTDRELTATRVDMASLAAQIGGHLNEIVRDETTLPGYYSVALHWDEEDTSSPAAMSALLQRELGLRLERRKVNEPTVIVTHIERPAAN